MLEVAYQCLGIKKKKESRGKLDLSSGPSQRDRRGARSERKGFFIVPSGGALSFCRIDLCGETGVH